MRPYSRGALAQALLLGDHELYQLYQTSPSFKYSIDGLVDIFLPALVRGLAQQATEVDRRQAEAQELAMRIPPLDIEQALKLMGEGRVTSDEAREDLS
jgi:hypothetical protein